MLINGIWNLRSLNVFTLILRVWMKFTHIFKYFGWKTFKILTKINNSIDKGYNGNSMGQRRKRIVCRVYKEFHYPLSNPIRLQRMASSPSSLLLSLGNFHLYFSTCLTCLVSEKKKMTGLILFVVWGSV